MLRAHELRLLLAVPPQAIEEVPLVVRACEVQGVEVGLWPLLNDAQGRWVNTQSLELFETQLQRLVASLQEQGLKPREIVFDLEPSFTETRALVQGRRRALRTPLRRPADPAAASRLEGLVAGVREQGIEATAAIAPMLVWDAQANRTGWQRVMGTPIQGVPFDRYEVIVYSSLLEGYARGLLRREDAVGLVGDFCATARRHFGERASVSLGVVQVGALGDERPYRSVQELADDASVAQAAGLTQLSLHELAGVLMRPPAERWLGTFADAPTAQGFPAPTWRGRAVSSAGRSLSRSLDTLATWHQRASRTVR